MDSIKSYYPDWVEISNKWYNTASQVLGNLYVALEELKKAQSEVSKAGDIGRLSLSVTYSDIEKHNENRRKMVSFCNSIHYEISEKVDNPFSTGMSETLQQAYKLNPSNIKVKTGSFLGIGTYTSLANLLKATYTDDKLRKDFLKQCEALDKDKIKPSSNLGEAIKEAAFWENEFKKSAECQAIAERIFTSQVRENWDSYTENERKAIITNYAQSIGQVLYGERGAWDKIFDKYPSIVKNVRFDASGYGVSYGNGTIGINEDFVVSPVENYSVDKVIDTVTHEVRHEYQQRVKNNPSKFGVPKALLDEWNQPYISSKTDYDLYYGQDVERDARAFAALSRPEYEED